MATVLDVVSVALRHLGVKTAESAIEPNEAVDGLVDLNDMMNWWNVDGIDVGYESLEDPADEIFTTLGSIAAMKANLAIYIAPQYDKVVTKELTELARVTKKGLRSSIRLKSASFPDTLPIGSGNEENHFETDGDSPGNLFNRRFYPSNVPGKCS